MLKRSFYMWLEIKLGLNIIDLQSIQELLGYKSKINFLPLFAIIHTII